MISWEDLEAAAADVFNFLDTEVSAVSQLFRMHPTREGRLEFLGNLRDAALGSSLSEGFLSLDAGELGCEPPEVILIVTIGGSHEPTLDDEIRTAWANTTVGLRVERVTDPTAISLMGLVYGFPVTAIKEWPEVEGSFQSVKAREGLGIYPVLSPLRVDAARMQLVTEPFLQIEGSPRHIQRNRLLRRVRRLPRLARRLAKTFRSRPRRPGMGVAPNECGCCAAGPGCTAARRVSGCRLVGAVEPKH